MTYAVESAYQILGVIAGVLGNDVAALLELSLQEELGFEMTKGR